MEHQQNHHQEEDLSYRSLTSLSSNEKGDFRNTPTLVEPIIIKDKEGSFLLQSLLSNLIFLCAGTLYMIGSIWDITPPNGEETRANEVYNWIWRLAPITYLFNSMIDIKLADRIRRHRKKIKLVTASSSSSSDRNVRLIMSHGDERGLNNDNRNSFEKIRKHAAHRRELGAALSFFVAALYGTFVEIAEATGGDDMLLLFLDRVSIHSYLLSALLALAGSDIVKGKCRQLDFNDSASLENLGDVFFFIGSVVDVILCDFHFDDEIFWWPIASSSLWFIDALFYLKSDISSLRDRNEQNNNSSNSAIEVQMQRLETIFV